MLCRNFFCLKSNQYFWFSSSNSWYIFVCWISLFCINFAPHFTLLKFFGRRQFPEILKLPFSPVFTRVSHEFCMYFQTTYYRPVAGGSNGTPAALPRGQTGPPNPRLPTQQGWRSFWTTASSGTARRFLKCISKFLQQAWQIRRKWDTSLQGIQFTENIPKST